MDQAILLVPKAYQPETLIGRPLPGLGVLLAIGIVFTLGIAAQSVIGRQLVRLYEAVLQQVPLLSSLYNGLKQLLEQLFSSRRGFEAVVLLQWPREGIWCVGFVTGDAHVKSLDGREWVNIFLPTTPNPTTGYYLMCPKDEVVDTKLPVETGFKLLMSAGIVSPEEPIALPGGLSIAEVTAGNQAGRNWQGQ